MAQGWGGARRGAGRKPKSAEEKAVTGNPGHRRAAAVVQHPSVPMPVVVPALPVVDEADVPDDLTMAERRVYLRLAPAAMANGTLTARSGDAFSALCRTAVLVEELAAAPLYKGTPNHRAWVLALDGMLANFGLRPIGKPMPDAQTQPERAVAANPLERFMRGRA